MLKSQRSPKNCPVRSKWAVFDLDCGPAWLTRTRCPGVAGGETNVRSRRRARVEKAGAHPGFTRLCSPFGSLLHVKRPSAPWSLVRRRDSNPHVVTAFGPKSGGLAALSAYCLVESCAGPAVEAGHTADTPSGTKILNQRKARSSRPAADGAGCGGAAPNSVRLFPASLRHVRPRAPSGAPDKMHGPKARHRSPMPPDAPVQSRN
jgi:hypothetical protein